MPTEPWAPSVADVAKRIPTRTRDTRSPGSDRLLHTFTPDTTPDDGAAYNAIEAAVAWVMGQVDDSLDYGDAQMTTHARAAAEWRAAADIELSYPNRDADIRVYQWLDQRAKDEMEALVKYITIVTGKPPGGVGHNVVHSVVWVSLAPPPWADIDPDYRFRYGIAGSDNARVQGSRYAGSPGASVGPARTRTEPGEG